MDRSDDKPTNETPAVVEIREVPSSPKTYGDQKKRTGISRIFVVGCALMCVISLGLSIWTTIRLQAVEKENRDLAARLDGENRLNTEILDNVSGWLRENKTLDTTRSEATRLTRDQLTTAGDRLDCLRRQVQESGPIEGPKSFARC